MTSDGTDRFRCVSCGWSGSDPDTTEYEKTEGPRCPDCGFTGIQTAPSSTEAEDPEGDG